MERAVKDAGEVRKENPQREDGWLSTGEGTAIR